MAAIIKNEGDRTNEKYVDLCNWNEKKQYGL